MPQDPLGQRAERARIIQKVMESIDELTVQVAEVFGQLAEFPAMGSPYPDLVGDLEKAMQQYVEKADALTYRLEQDRERGRW